MKRLTAIVLAFIMALALTACGGSGKAASGSSETEGSKVTLNKVGTVSADVLEYARFSGDGIYQSTSDGKYQILDKDGKNALGQTYDYIDESGAGAWIVYQADKGVNCCGLVKADGTVLIPVSAASIELVQSGSKVQFAEVLYATDEVTSQEEAFLYATSDIVSLQPGEKDKLYAGYSLFYDLEREQFVGSLKRTDTFDADRIYAVGDKLFFSRSGVIYDRNGSEFAAFTGGKVGDFFIDRTDDNKNKVYDCNMQEIAVFDEYPAAVYDDGRLFAFSDYHTDLTTIRNVRGEQIGDLPFKYAPKQNGSLLFGCDAQDNYLVMDLNGKTILDAEAYASNGITYVGAAPLGYLNLSFADGGRGLLYPDGTIVKGDGTYGVLCMKKLDTGIAALVLNKKDFSLKLPDENGIHTLLNDYECMPILFAATKDGTQVLFNAVNGKELLKSDARYYFDAFHYANGYLYAKQGDVYEIYRVKIAD